MQNTILNDMNKLCRLLCLVVVCFIATSYELYSQEADNTFSVNLQATTRGELRHGGFKSDSIDNYREANFVIGKYRLDLDYKRSWLELRLSPQQSGVWGQASGSLSLFEGWALVKSEKGFFAKIGRQLLAYDDERILGYDDWTMTAPTHDVLKFGYEGDRHKVHIILAYNQTATNPDEGNTYYANGLQPHKSMQTLWYHYDTPKSLFGASLLFMNIGMQSANDANLNTTFYQQLLGTYLSFKPKNWLLEGAFYYQMGKQEYGMTLDAFMGSAKVKHSFNDKFSLQAGYDYLSGDKYFAVPPHGGIGMVFHDKCRGFNPIYLHSRLAEPLCWNCRKAHDVVGTQFGLPLFRHHFRVGLCALQELRPRHRVQRHLFLLRPGQTLCRLFLLEWYRNHGDPPKAGRDA